MTRPKRLRPVDDDAAQIARAHLGASPDDPCGDLSESRTGGREPICLGAGGLPETIRVLGGSVGSQVIPNTYVTDGRVVHVDEVSGTAVAKVQGDEDSLLPVTSSTLTPPLLARLLAEHTYTHKRMTPRDGGNPYPAEATPATTALSAVLSGKSWPGLPPLHAIVGAPVLRPDGTLLQRPGYDAATGLYLAGRVQLERVPEQPTAAQVAESRAFLLEVFLRDFPWTCEADKANHLALMVTPVLRPYTRALTPFGVVSATMPGSGKTILTASIGMIYGQRVLSWTHSDEELRKAITSVLADQAGVVVFDNLHEGAVIDSPILARLITERVWADRTLGKNSTVAYPNDRLWLATGNNLNVGGDMASRTVLVQLDPNMPNPEQRTGFAIGQLDHWILNPANQRTVLWHLLVLIADWIAAGGPRAHGLAMRQFTTWAEAVGGLLAHHGVPGFLANAGTVQQVDEGAAEWGAFLARWYEIHGSAQLTASQVRASAEPPYAPWPERPRDPWEGAFFTDIKGNPISPKALGVRLRGQVGRWRGHYVLRKGHDPIRNSGVYWVEVK